MRGRTVVRADEAGKSTEEEEEEDGASSQLHKVCVHGKQGV
jgi:hypothetical protein